MAKCRGFSCIVEQNSVTNRSRIEIRSSSKYWPKHLAGPYCTRQRLRIGTWYTVTRIIYYIINEILFSRTIHQSYGILHWTVNRITQMEPRVEIECNIVSLWGFVNRISRGARKKYSDRGLRGDALALYPNIYVRRNLYPFCFFRSYIIIIIISFIFSAYGFRCHFDDFGPGRTADKIKKHYKCIQIK